MVGSFLQRDTKSAVVIGCEMRPRCSPEDLLRAALSRTILTLLKMAERTSIADARKSRRTTELGGPVQKTPSEAHVPAENPFVREPTGEPVHDIPGISGGGGDNVPAIVYEYRRSWRGSILLSLWLLSSLFRIVAVATLVMLSLAADVFISTGWAFCALLIGSLSVILNAVHAHYMMTLLRKPEALNLPKSSFLQAAGLLQIAYHITFSCLSSWLWVTAFQDSRPSTWWLIAPTLMFGFSVADALMTAIIWRRRKNPEGLASRLVCPFRTRESFTSKPINV